MTGQNSNTTKQVNPKKMAYLNPESTNNSFSMQNWLSQIPSKILSLGARVLYCRLREWSKNGNAHRSAADLSLEIGVPKRTIEKYIQELKMVGLIETYLNQEGGHNNYRFFDHPWMHEPIIEQLQREQPTAKSADPTAKSAVITNKTNNNKNKDITESDDSPLVTQDDLISIYMEELPTLSHPRDPKKPSKGLSRSLNTLIKRWPTEISEKGNQLTKDVFRTLIKKLKEIDYWMLRPEKDVGMIIFCRVNSIQLAIEKLIAHEKQGKK